MKIVAYYSFNKGYEFIKENFGLYLEEVKKVIYAIDAFACKTKEGHEERRSGKMLFSPVCMNNCFKQEFNARGWGSHREACEYVYGTYLANYIPPINKPAPRPFREMDFIKPGIRLGVEVQFGKYAFMVYNVCAKMTIFHNFDIIDAGIEIVPTKHLADEMSSGVSYFEQIAWDLEKRGVANIDLPVLVLGLDA